MPTPSPATIEAGVAAIRRREPVRGDDGTRLAICHRALGEMSAHTSPLIDPAERGLRAMFHLRDACRIDEPGAIELRWLAGLALSLRPREAIYCTLADPEGFASMMGTRCATGEEPVSAAVVSDAYELMELRLTPDCRFVHVRPAGSYEGEGFTSGRAVFGRIASLRFGDVGHLDVYAAVGRGAAPADERLVPSFEMAAVAALLALPQREGAERASAVSRPGAAKAITHRATPQGAVADDGDPVFDRYVAHRAVAATGRPHPSQLVQPMTFASMASPPITAEPRLDPALLVSGAISDAQFEAVAMAMTAHGKTAQGGTRYGYLLADGTGVGKNREELAIFLANRNEGRRKGVYITEKSRHRANVVRDMVALGMSERDIIDMADYAASADLPLRDGLLFTTYAQVRRSGEGQESFPRVDQIVNWVGEKFEGVVVLDESHNLGNAVAEETPGRFSKDPSNQGVAVGQLQDRLPGARVIYASATGVSKPNNVGYMKRLGLWGVGSYFPTSEALISELSRSGLSGLEIISTSLVAAGLMCARTLSLDGVTTSSITHQMGPREIETWDTVITLCQKIKAGIKETWPRSVGRKAMSEPADLTVRYEGAKRRLVELMLVSFKTPTLIAAMERDLEEGRCPVVQLKNTYAAEADDEAKTLASTLTALVDQMIAVHVLVPEERCRAHEKGTMRGYRKATGPDGMPIPCPENVAIKAELLAEIALLPQIETPLDQIVDRFGGDDVAEITGRANRTVRQGSVRRTEARSEALVRADHSAFMDGRKRILAFSMSMGGASMDYHASLDCRNQAKRMHYILQAGDRADLAVQGIGRTHRSNQKQPPHVLLVSTSLKAERVYRSRTLARMRSLGAAGQGHRDAAGGNSFSMRDSYESEYSKAAFVVFLNKMAANAYPSIPLEHFEELTNVRLVENGAVVFRTTQDFFTKVIGRIAGTVAWFQEAVFDAIDREIEEVVRNAVTDRSFDTGPEILSEPVSILSEEVVATDPQTGASLSAFEVEGITMPKVLEFAEAQDEAALYNVLGQRPRFGWCPQTSQLFLVVTTGTDAEGYPNEYRVIEPNRSSMNDGTRNPLLQVEWLPNYDINAMRAMWERRIENLRDIAGRPAVIFAGALPLVYEAIKTDHGMMRPVVARTTTGRRLMGMMVDRENGHAIRLAAAHTTSERRNAAVDIRGAMAALDDRRTVVFGNGWMMNVQSVAGQDRIELHVPRSDAKGFDRTARTLGLAVQTIGRDRRYFMKPDREEQMGVLRPLVARNGISHVTDAPDWSGFA